MDGSLGGLSSYGDVSAMFYESEIKLCHDCSGGSRASCFTLLPEISKSC